MDTLSPKQLLLNADFAVSIIDRVVNAAMLPVEQGMNDEMKKELDKYFHREEKKEEKQEEKK